MPKVTFTQPDGTSRTLEVPKGMSLMDAAVINGVDGILGECGGQAICATCHVYVRSEYAASLPPAEDLEGEMLACTAAERTNRSRLACQIILGYGLDEIAVDIPTEQE